MNVKLSMRRILSSLLLAIFLVHSGSPAYADSNALQDLLKLMKDKGSLSNEEFNRLRLAAKEDDKKKENTTQDLPLISTRGKFEVKDGDWKWRFGGRMMHDITAWSTDGDFDDAYASGQEFRRARFYTSGRMGENWDFKLQIDFTDTKKSQSAVEDAYLRYRGLPITLTIGQAKAPFSLNELTSSKYITFVERSLVTEAFAGLVGNRRAGITGHYAQDGFTIAGGTYINRTTNDAAPTSINDGYVFTGRTTFAPLREEGRSIHLGAAAGWRNLNGQSLRVRSRPEVHIADRPIDQDGVPGDDVFVYGLEWATVFGSFSTQAEYMAYDLDGGNFGPDANGAGWYVYSSYFLTGESRNYNWRKGAFDSLAPGSNVGQGGTGAWEIGVRYSTADLDDTGIAGGEIENLTIALNWYATKNLMWKLNYVKVLNCNANCEDGFASGKASAVTLRTQFYW